VVEGGLILALVVAEEVVPTIMELAQMDVDKF
jgi:hypothetical protein